MSAVDEVLMVGLCGFSSSSAVSEIFSLMDSSSLGVESLLGPEPCLNRMTGDAKADEVLNSVNTSSNRVKPIPKVITMPKF